MGYKFHYSLYHLMIYSPIIRDQGMIAEPLHSAPRLTPAMAALRATWSGCTARCTSAASCRGTTQRIERRRKGKRGERPAKMVGVCGLNMVEPGFVLEKSIFLSNWNVYKCMIFEAKWLTVSQIELIHQNEWVHQANWGIIPLLKSQNKRYIMQQKRADQAKVRTMPDEMKSQHDLLECGWEA